MTDLNKLTSEALGTIQDAQGHLNARQLQVTDPEELMLIEVWRKALQEVAEKIQPVVAVNPPEHEPGYQTLSEHLNLIRKHIKKLDVAHDYANVDMLFKVLHDQLQVFVGPNGPGGGRPRKIPKLG
jgi:hypothetical protein